MAKNGVEGFESRELFVASFTGFRNWKLTGPPDAPVLSSVSHANDWVQGVNEARCLSPATKLVCEYLTSDADHKHTAECRAPDRCDGVRQSCGCGFWAYETFTNWFGVHGTGSGMFGGSTPWVMGVIHGFGRMVIGTKGFRASKAVIAALVMPPVLSNGVEGRVSPERVEERRVLAERYEAGLRERYWSIPFYPSVEAMLERLPLIPCSPLLAKDQPPADEGTAA